MEQSEPLRGWRAYELRWAGGEDVILVGLAYGCWEGAQLQAQCRHAGFVSSSPYGIVVSALSALRDPAQAAHEHLLATKCGCGIYGVFRLSDLETWERSMTNRCGIRAAAVGWGVGVVGDRGWRAQWGRIERIWFSPRCVICGEPANAGLFAGKGSGPLLLCPEHEGGDSQWRRLSPATRLSVERIRQALQQRYDVPVIDGEPEEEFIVTTPLPGMPGETASVA